MNLIHELVCEEFDGNQRDVFVNKLASVQQHTDTVLVDSPNVLQIKPSGTIGNDGYRMNRWFFYQLCHALGDGLYTLIDDLLSADDGSVSQIAIGVINQLVNTRFNRLSDRLILRNKATRTFEALVTSAYFFMSNVDMFEQFSEAINLLPTDIRFFGGTLHGRWMSARYIQVKPGGKLLDDSPVYPAWYVSNHEGGKASARVANSIIGGASMSGWLWSSGRRGRIKHRSSLAKKLLRRFREVSLFEWDFKAICREMNELRSYRIGLGNLEEKKDKQATARVISFLRKLTSAPASILARCVAGAITQPYFEKNAVPYFTLRHTDIAKRTMLDLAFAISRYAKVGDIAIRESLEYLAMRLLRGDYPKLPEDLRS